jgi:F-type H+-transporting ATPase subunit b
MSTATTSESSSGMPQLNFDTFSNQAFWLIIVLVCVFFMVKILIIPRMDNILTNRRKMIEEDLVGAESLRDQANNLKNTINNEVDVARLKAQEMLLKSKEKNKITIENALSDAKEITSKLIDESEAKLADSKKNADKNVKIIADTLLTEILDKILPQKSKSSGN